jgi:hypothetical protein
MASLEEIRTKLLAKENKKFDSAKGKSGSDHAIYQFWNIPEGSQATIRFLPDGDPSNDFFWVERLVLNLPFQGVKGDSSKGEVKVTVPCMQMYGEECPVIAETRSWWNDPELKEVARKYWKKKSYVFQGFVVNSPFEEQNVPENPIRRFAINTSLFEIIKASLMNTDFEDLPTDYINGRDFKISKTTKGGYANYTTSNWSMRTRSLGADEASAIEAHGLYNLKDYLPKKPTSEELEVIKEMFKASVDGDAYDPSRFGNYYRPFGVGRGSDDDDVITPRTTIQVTKPVEVEDEVVTTIEARSSAPVDALAALKARASTISTSATEDETSSSAKPDATEILRRIRERQANK